MTEVRQFYEDLTVSPDDRYVSTTIWETGGIHIAVLDRERGTLNRLVLPSLELAADPIWSPDGEWLAVAHDEGRITRRRPDGTGPAELLVDTDRFVIPDAFSPDGDWFVYSELGDAQGRDIWLVALHEGDLNPREFIRTPANEWGMRISPDGASAAYVSDEAGLPEVYLRPFPEPGPVVQVSSGGGDQPVWARDGSELFYLDGDRMMSVSIGAGEEIRIGRPEELFRHPFSTRGFFVFAVTRDGKFLAIERDPLDQSRIHIALNWEPPADR